MATVRDTTDDKYPVLSSGLLSPHHILSPETFQKFPAPIDLAVPMVEAIRLMKESLELLLKIMETSNTPTPLYNEILKPPIMRMEMRVSHPVDPLCWLQAQMENNPTSLQRQFMLSGKGTPAFYFASAEGTLETAVYGSSRTHEGALQEEKAWQSIVARLPDRARVYGGQRFDTESKPSQEWKSFETGYWMIPAVELRMERPLQQAKGKRSTTLAIHLVQDPNVTDGLEKFEKSARHVLSILQRLSDEATPATPPTTLPPVLSRSSTYSRPETIGSASDSNTLSSTPQSAQSVTPLDGQEVYERGVAAALEEFSKSKQIADSNETAPKSNNKPSSKPLEKVVLARRLDLRFAQSAYANVRALDILRKWKFASQPGGHLFYLCPGVESEFFGCTPERLFDVVTVEKEQGNSTLVVSEALAGTRPRGSTPAADQELARQLFSSVKDQAENKITGKFIMEAFEELYRRGWVQKSSSTRPNEDEAEPGNDNYDGITLQGSYFVRRLRHLQHICQQFQCELTSSTFATTAIQHLLTALHPTPAVCGYPKRPAMDFIRKHEAVGFDRGYYSGPVGFVGRQEASIVVAIRSGLLSQDVNSKPVAGLSSNAPVDGTKRPRVSVYAGAGLVPGSTVQGEWAETSYKLAVVSSIFPQSPITLQSAQTPNSAWATAFIEELIRNGVTQFYICPGSRSTPLVAAVAKAVRSNVGIVHAMSVHDERGAAFRALGYGRGKGKPAAVITSSGTAIANLYPAIVEAGMDAVPLILLTADRPYESRDTGANQAIDQVKAFSQTYVRWFRDILPPHDDVPVSVALADATHGVSLSKSLMGPVHLNVQFRENLAPDAGPIRNDDRVDSVTNFNNVRFTDSAGFQRWSLGGRRWAKTSRTSSEVGSKTVLEILSLMMESKRGIIVVGNIRKPVEDDRQHDDARTFQLISSLAQVLGFPVFAGVQASSMRFQSAAVVPYAEHILRCPIVHENLQPDFVLQLGAPLITTEIPKIIKKTMDQQAVEHILVQDLHPTERADPEFTVTHNINTDIDAFVSGMLDLLNSEETSLIGSQLAPIVELGRMLQKEMPRIVNAAVNNIRQSNPGFEELTEPEVVMKLSEIMTNDAIPDVSLFLSNSMPVRDADAFLYPSSSDLPATSSLVGVAGVNRGASGIDGVIASAAGFADSVGRPTTLLIGDVAALHDINSLHSLRTGMTAAEVQAQKVHPLTTIVLNNDGGGIFSFLPIAKHGSDVSFDEFFGTPTSTFSFEKGAAAFDLPFQRVTNSSAFKTAYVESISKNKPSIIEAVVASRDVNVAVHKEITARTNAFLSSVIKVDSAYEEEADILPVKKSRSSFKNTTDSGERTLVLLHGWMGDYSEWSRVVSELLSTLPPEWSILSVDLPGHGESKICKSPIKGALRLEEGNLQHSGGLAVDDMALAVAKTLKAHGMDKINALAGYSLGGRVALALKRLSMVPNASNESPFTFVNEDTKLILVSTYPGDITTSRNRDDSVVEIENLERIFKDEIMAAEMDKLANIGILSSIKPDSTNPSLWSKFLHCWYEASLWGSLRSRPYEYSAMLDRRLSTLSVRARDAAEVLRQCSPPKCSTEDWRGVNGAKTLFVAGELDRKYSNLGRKWIDVEPTISYCEIANKGHALLVEAAAEVAQAIAGFLLEEKDFQSNEQDAKIWDVDFIPSTRVEDLSPKQLVQQERKIMGSMGSLEIEPFQIELVNENNGEGVSGIGWVERSIPIQKKSLKQRSGFFVQILSQDGLGVGIGEVSPLKGLHTESLEMAGDQLDRIAGSLSKLDPSDIPFFDATSILSLDGSLAKYIDLIASIVKEDKLLPSVRAGLEMALLSLASQTVRLPILKAFMMHSPRSYKLAQTPTFLPLNGLITRKAAGAFRAMSANTNQASYISWKVKIGHQSLEEDLESFQTALSKLGSGLAMIRADANRAFDEVSYSNLVSNLREVEPSILKRLEYIEEPLQKQIQEDSAWSLDRQISALERGFHETQIPYALDESIFDLIEFHDNDMQAVVDNLASIFANGTRGCAAIVLKPSLLGFENSLRLARLAKSELGVGAVFTSSFDSGIGLSYISFLASIADASPSKQMVPTYPHGLGTFEMLTNDSLSPPFGSYVNQEGLLNVASLSRAFYGLALDELQSLSSESVPPTLPALDQSLAPSGLSQPESETDEALLSGGKSRAMDFPADEFEASTSSSGRDVVLVASLPLPFSADVACARFTDLPQQPRWSPWLASVAYLDAGGETEWTLRVRGVNFRWRAKSELLESPYKGIRWQSTSGVKNTGVVEFVPPLNGNEASDSCIMKVRMAFVVPRLLSSLFKGTIVEDFLRNKIMKWSLEMFRDVVKGDLALEEGNIELGDALFGAVEGKASAIEATLASSRGSTRSNEDSMKD
jgi:2-succinyl-5-enolpyruvyl-6-hydroxy-3-cyclohexene-1-carboxylate synthase/o-succinylbenzoate synthase